VAQAVGEKSTKFIDYCGDILISFSVNSVCQQIKIFLRLYLFFFFLVFLGFELRVLYLLSRSFLSLDLMKSSDFIKRV
jgi:hypothetical protein